MNEKKKYATFLEVSITESITCDPGSDIRLMPDTFRRNVQSDTIHVCTGVERCSLRCISASCWEVLQLLIDEIQFEFGVFVTTIDCGAQGRGFACRSWYAHLAFFHWSRFILARFIQQYSASIKSESICSKIQFKLDPSIESCIALHNVNRF